MYDSLESSACVQGRTDQLPVTTPLPFQSLKKLGHGLIQYSGWSGRGRGSGHRGYGRWPSDGWIHGIHLCQRRFWTVPPRFRRGGSLGKSKKSLINWISILSMDRMPLQPWARTKSNMPPSEQGSESSHSHMSADSVVTWRAHGRCYLKSDLVGQKMELLG